MMKNGQIRTFRHVTQKYGHTSVLNKEEQVAVAADNDPKLSPVVYAGEIIPDKSGKVDKINNNSGHFLPKKDQSAAVVKAFGLTAAKFHGLGAHEISANFLKKFESDEDNAMYEQAAENLRLAQREFEFAQKQLNAF